MTTTRYLLVRRLPTGEIRSHITPFETTERAARAAGQSLWDNGAERLKSAAQKFGAKLTGQPVGIIWGHPSGYDFRILEADFTSDRKLITPGLRVLDYDREWGVVDPAQFMDMSSMMPGGEYFDRWYYTIRDGEDRPRKRFNGERLATDEPRSLR